MFGFCYHAALMFIRSPAASRQLTSDTSQKGPLVRLHPAAIVSLVIYAVVFILNGSILPMCNKYTFIVGFMGFPGRVVRHLVYINIYIKHMVKFILSVLAR